MSPLDLDGAWSWVEHLRAGGTTPWTRWTGERPAVRPPPTVPLPGAQQLELLRRINLLDPSRPPAPPLARRVLEASAFGRGRGDLALVGASSSRFGAPPVDPAALPASELLRVAALLLADELAAGEAAGDPSTAAGRSARRPLGSAAGPAADRSAGRRWAIPPQAIRPRAIRPRVIRRGWRLVGDPWVADQLHTAMRARGDRPGGRRAVVHVAAGPVDRLLADVWTHRCLRGPEPPWADWVARHGGASGGLPAGADVAGTAEDWAQRVGPRRVVVVTDPAALPRLLGARRLAPPQPLGAEAAELARLVAIALDVVVVPDRRPAVLRDQLLPLLRAHEGPGRPLRVPAAELAAVRRRAERQRDRVREAGYAVRGDVDDLLVARSGAVAGGRRHADRGPAGPDADGALDLAGRILTAGGRPERGGGPR